MMFNILKVTCDQLAPFLRVIAYLFKVLKIAIPILLIVLVTIDMGKALISNDDKQVKDATNKSIKRIIYALIIYIVPTLIALLFKLVTPKGLGNDGLGSATDWISCYNSVR